MKTLYIVTGNQGKYKEFSEKLGSENYELIQDDKGYPEIQADSLEEVAQFGIKYVSQRCKQPFFLEDSGLFIDALHGFPGVYSKYVFFTLGLPGILQLLQSKKIKDRAAVFRSVIGYYEPDQEPRLFIGECKGFIGMQMIGNNGFGYDPLFIPKGKQHTFAEMTTEEKNLCSHRGKAVEQLLKFLYNKK